jgi:hypothetical protein
MIESLSGKISSSSLLSLQDNLEGRTPSREDNEISAAAKNDQVEISDEAQSLYASSILIQKESSSLSSQGLDQESKENQDSLNNNSGSKSTSNSDPGHALIQTGKNAKNNESKQEKNSEDKSKHRSKKSESSSAKSTKELTDSEKREVSRLKKRDAEVRTHEQAHLSAAGSLAAGGASFEYEKGPDGNKYAVGGEVPLATGTGSTPEEKLRNAERVYRAALAPANPSSQDRAIASQASSDAMKARAEIAKEQNSQSSKSETSETEQTSNPVGSEKETAWEKAIAAYKNQSASPQYPDSSNTSTSIPHKINISA